ncbi:hypothetical protein J1N10_07640 [Carboxylicivirga sp. A043]|uniref:hypothetical protein n=1 Tax=Carboxylicivirga litoralis TaxID=2816963 RepID=UPI0021CB8CDB|nr:hypothetical protein [Carboxylicivirga sp. A043]MCU4155846.1 hypothetical protein [Carboxylicivirga sp. A043]
MNKLIILLSLILVSSCNLKNDSNRSVHLASQEVKTDSIIKHTNIEHNKSEAEKIKQKDDSLVVDGSIGLIVLENYTTGKWIIKNEDNSMFESFDFEQEESQDYYNKLDSVTSHFDLFAYKPDYGLLIIKSNIDKDNYLIETRSYKTKLISKSNTNFKFYTWTEFLLSDQYVSISEHNLKFYDLPIDSSEFKIYEASNANELFAISATEIKTDWIKIKRESLVNDTIKPNDGWTRWCKDGKLIIDFWFLL